MLLPLSRFGYLIYLLVVAAPFVILRLIELGLLLICVTDRVISRTGAYTRMTYDNNAIGSWFGINGFQMHTTTYLTFWLAAPLAHYGGHRLSAATLHCGCNRKSVDRCLSDRVTFAQAAPMSWTSILEQVIKVIVMRRYSNGNGIYFNCTEWHCYAIVILSIRDKLITIGRIHKGR